MPDELIPKGDFTGGQWCYTMKSTNKVVVQVQVRSGAFFVVKGVDGKTPEKEFQQSFSWIADGPVKVWKELRPKLKWAPC